MKNERSVSAYEEYGEAVPGTDAALRVHVFVSTDTLPSLAEEYLDDWRLWPMIADRNQVEDPRQIAPGTRLVIPNRQPQIGRYESA